MKAAIYIRVSTDKEEQETSLVYQRQFFEDFVKEKRWDVYNFYVDIDSGTKRNREKLKQLIADGKEKKFDVILSKELSRLARNQGLAFELKEIVETKRIHLITMDGAINTLEGHTNMFGLYAWIYEQEAQQTSNRIKMALETRAKKGHFKGSNPPYGYKVHDGKLFLSDNGTPDIVKRIFKRYLEGKGFDAIARELYNEGVKTPSQIARKNNQSPFWNGSSVRQILENPNYTGNLVQGRTSTMNVTNKKRIINSEEKYIFVENTHEAIISKETFETVQALIASRRKKSLDNSNINSRPHENVHLFTGVIYCDDCGSSFHYKKNRSGYICGRYNKHGNKACSDHHVREDMLKSIIQSDLKKLAINLHDEGRYTFIKEKLKKESIKLEKELKLCNSNINFINQLKSKALTKYLEGNISKVDYDMFVSLKDSEINELQASKVKIEMTLSKMLDTEILAKIKDLVDETLKFNNFTREVINRFIEKIEVKADGTVKLFYRFSWSSKVLNELI